MLQHCVHVSLRTVTGHFFSLPAVSAVLRFTTGHMVPQTRPLEAYNMFTRFIHNQPLQPEP